MKKLLFVCVVSFVVISFVSCGGRVKVSWKKSVSVPQQPRNVHLNVFIENSGSMCGYMVDGSELKDAVYSYVSDLDGYVDTTRLFYINSEIFSFKEGLKKFIHGMTPTGIMSIGGNKSNSNIDEMFELMLRNTAYDQVSIFVSDCILDVPNGNATNFFENSKTTIRNAFRHKLKEDKNFGVEVFRLKSRYSGMYFLPAGGTERLDSVSRPYYMFVMGNKNILAYLNSKCSLKNIKGLENKCAFTSYSVLSFDITNNFGKPFPQCEMDVRPDKDGNYSVCIKADFRPTLQDAQTICSLSNYDIDRNGSVIVEQVEPIKDEPEFTHRLTLKAKSSIKSSAVNLGFAIRDMPDWVSMYNDDSGKNVKNNIEKTTGIKYIIQGIFDAFKDADNLKLGEFNFIINRR